MQRERKHRQYPLLLLSSRFKVEENRSRAHLTTSSPLLPLAGFFLRRTPNADLLPIRQVLYRRRPPAYCRPQRNEWKEELTSRPSSLSPFFLPCASDATSSSSTTPPSSLQPLRRRPSPTLLEDADGRLIISKRRKGWSSPSVGRVRRRRLELESC